MTGLFVSYSVKTQLLKIDGSIGIAVLYLWDIQLQFQLMPAWRVSQEP
jgi:hypothetical protein